MSDFLRESQSQPGFGVGLTLRDRIAAAITGIRIQRDGDSYKMADAVIAELLKQQWRADLGYGYFDCDTREEAAEMVDDFNATLSEDWQDGEQAVVLHRYVTEWTADE